jgi:hypothetical protein
MLSTQNKFSQEDLTPINLTFLNYLKKNKESMQILSEDFLERGKKYCNFDLSKSLQALPTFVSREKIEEIEKAMADITKLLQSTPKRLQNYDQFVIRKYHNLDQEEFNKNYERSIEEIEKTTGRMDFLFTESGIKCLEFNVGISCGGWENKPILDLYKSNNVIDAFCKKNSIKLTAYNTLQCYLDFYITKAFNQIKDIEDEFNLIVWYNPLEIFKKNSPQYYYFKMLKSINVFDVEDWTIQMNEYEKAFYHSEILKTKKNMKASIVIADNLDKVNINDRKLYYDGARVHVVLPFLGFPVTEIEKELDKESVIFTEYPSNRLLAKKLYFATLSENENSDVFSAEEKDIIKKYLPWARRFFPVKTNFKGEEIYLDSFCKNNKDLFVLKENNSYGGKGVYIGKDLEQTEWENILFEALKTDQFIVQEYIESLTYNYLDKTNNISPHRVCWGTFIMGDKFAGGFARPQLLSSSSKINVSQGSSISFFVEGQTI